jgi:hypothetical protein
MNSNATGSTRSSNDKGIDPNETYYSLSFKLERECKWIHSPRLTQSSLYGMLNLITFMQDFNITDIRVMPEKLLDEHIFVKTKSGEFKEISLRTFIIDPTSEPMPKFFQGRSNNKETVEASAK